MYAKEISNTPQKILVVDDEAIIRDMMTDILDMEGYPIEVARNGRDALDILAADPRMSYLIFLDLMMPVVSGYDFCQTLSQDPARRQHVIILMSALDQLAKATALSVDQTMPKPFTVDDIMHIIQTYMPEHI
ncbi:response regulator [Dictyobacter aurantiacus]|uniref:Response regulator n=1 Tax=Dictyobacter aurantiacus TaxID=1936993 RepID=A0A401ZD52_9CHLR|nr:response regulator [Dictyobacter aurantiacus]GCE04814.1 response regulator [Dictyobacter aurantiacus]